MQESTSGNAGSNNRAAQFLTFRVGEQEYGIDILSVQEIKGMTLITPLPGTPPHIPGVINLRGSIVPVVDLRLRFGSPKTEYDKFAAIIILSIGNRLRGLIVDQVSDVLDQNLATIEGPPELGSGVDISAIQGLARVGERMVILLAVHKVTEEIDQVAA